ncbi:MAG: YHS domain-containing protein [Candidatus Omnitrophota bacterium]
MKKRVIGWILVFFVSTVAGGAGFVLAEETDMSEAEQSIEQSEEQSLEQSEEQSLEQSSGEIGEIINEYCPIMGTAVDKNTPYKVIYENKNIGFCCKGCMLKFQQDPEKYIENVETPEE